MPNYNLIEPFELASMAIDSRDVFINALGVALRDHIKALEVATESVHEALAVSRTYRNQVIPALQAQIAQLTATLNEKA